MRSSFDITLSEIKASRATPIVAYPIVKEFVSTYRRIVVLFHGTGYTIRISYKGICKEIKEWTKTYGDKDCAIAWAYAIADNRNIIMGCLTIKEAHGKWII